MSLFKRHRSTESGEQPAEVPSPPGLAEHAASQGWQPAAERPFGTPGRWRRATRSSTSASWSPGPPEGVGEVLTPEVQRRVMARDDWSFRAERYLFGCVSKGPFESVAEIDQRIEDVLGIIAAIPSTVIPDHVDHSADDIIARIDRLTSVEEAMAMLQELTPADREQLARSDTPLVAFADVTTPQEAMARMKGLGRATKMQLFTMFMRVRDDEGGS